jgi:hypothetical protein
MEFAYIVPLVIHLAHTKEMYAAITNGTHGMDELLASEPAVAKGIGSTKPCLPGTLQYHCFLRRRNQSMSSPAISMKTISTGLSLNGGNNGKLSPTSSLKTSTNIVEPTKRMPTYGWPRVAHGLMGLSRYGL